MKISVVIPCYNSSKTIRKCIESVFNQTFSPYEIIVIDDGSIDNTLQLLEDINEDKPQNIQYHILKQGNAGPSAARNKGIRHANGDWIAFLDSDDQWHIDKLKKQIKIIKNDTNIAFCGTLFESSKNFNVDELFKEIDFKSLLFKNYFNTPTVLVKKEIMNKFIFEENQSHSEDYKLWLNICYENKCILINQSLASNIQKKKIYGDSGLSSNLWKMEKGELSNYKYLYDSKKIGIVIFIAASIFSIGRYCKRIFF